MKIIRKKRNEKHFSIVVTHQQRKIRGKGVNQQLWKEICAFPATITKEKKHHLHTIALNYHPPGILCEDLIRDT